MNRFLCPTGRALVAALWLAAVLAPAAWAGTARGALTVKVVVLPACSAPTERCPAAGRASRALAPARAPESGAPGRPLRVIEQRNGENLYRTVVY